MGLQPIKDMDLEEFTNLVCYGRQLYEPHEYIDIIHELLDDFERVENLAQDKIEESNYDPNLVHEVTEDTSEAMSNLLTEILTNWAKLTYIYNRNTKGLMKRGLRAHREKVENVNNESK